MTFNSHPPTHLIGIGGAGMSAIARVLLGRGVPVSGSDQERSDTTDALTRLGATIFIGHDERHLGSASLVVRSSAVPDDNPEVAAARRRGIVVQKRAAFLGELMADQIGIAVAGSHGKTTTTGMIAHIFLALQLDPTIVVGGSLPLIKANGRAGQGNHFIIEADEYDRMFLGLRPRIGVVTNIEHDHPDIYPNAADYLDAYREFVHLLPDDGWLIASADDAESRRLLIAAAGRLPTIAFGANDLGGLPNDVSRFTGHNNRPNKVGGSDFTVEQDGMVVGVVRLMVPGRHNVANALAALAVAKVAGIDFDAAANALSSFKGMGRRFEIKGEGAGVTVVDDYAHHPTEIGATLEAARDRFGPRRIWAVWQPHTFSRTYLYLAEFQNCFAEADQLVVLDIYRSREKDSLGLDGPGVARSINHPHTHYAQDNNAAVDLLTRQVAAGDVVITMNAGDATAIGDLLLNHLKKVEQEAV